MGDMHNDEQAKVTKAILLSTDALDVAVKGISNAMVLIIKQIKNTI